MSQDEPLPSEIEALLFASPKPMSEAEIARAADISPERVAEVLAGLSERAKGRAFVLTKRLDGWAYTMAHGAPVPDAYHREVSRKRAPTEAERTTVTVIAMREPATIPEIEEVRKVALSRGVIEALIGRGWIRAALRRTDSGRALAYETTALFLHTFQLDSVSDMPTPEEAMSLNLDV